MSNPLGDITQSPAVTHAPPGAQLPARERTDSRWGPTPDYGEAILAAARQDAARRLEAWALTLSAGLTAAEISLLARAADVVRECR